MGDAIRPEVGAMLRNIPSVDELLSTPTVQRLLTAQPRWAVREAVREVLPDREGRVRGAA